MIDMFAGLDRELAKTVLTWHKCPCFPPVRGRCYGKPREVLAESLAVSESLAQACDIMGKESRPHRFHLTRLHDLLSILD